jgi:predicted nuclease with TOPRIM domain
MLTSSPDYDFPLERESEIGFIVQKGNCMKQLQELESKVKAIIAKNNELAQNIELLLQENEALAAKMIGLAQENAELCEKVAALETTNAALSIKFDEAQTQAIQGLDAVAQRDELSASLNQLLATIEHARLPEMAQ